MNKNQNYGKLKLICNNPSCINKSIVYRRYDAMNDQTCKKCGSVLVAAKNQKDIYADNKAKRELKELNANIS